MAQTPEKKSSFILYYSFRSMFEETTPEQCQRLIVAIFKFAEDGETTDFSDDALLKICYDQMTYLIGRNKQQYEKRCETNKKIAKTAWERKNKEMELQRKIINDQYKTAQERLEALRRYEELMDDEDRPFK